MAIFKCKMCGGTIEFQDGATVGVCDSCGTKQTLPRLDSDRKTNLYDRANHFRRNNEFDKAMSIYENILNEDPTDAEAYWSIVLCRYGIEYVEDPATHRRVPTVNRAQFTSIFDDEDYKSALKNADALQRAIYEDEARAINEIQKGILEISAKEEPFDVFICYKETDANDRRTPDSVLATDLYHQLTNEGFKVFFSRITLEDKLGQEYEPYIFAALNSAKAMVVLGTKPEHFNAVWVKNEWSRYLALIKAGAKKTLIPAYRDMDPYDLPEEFSHLQAQDMSKLGFMQDLIRGIKKLVKTDEPKQTIRETIVTSATTAATAPLLRRAFMFLEDGEWNSANEYCEKVLDVEPENAEAYLGKLMAELHVKNRDDLKNQPQPFDDRNNYRKAMRFGDDALKKKLTDDVAFINDRNETARKEGIYQDALAEMKKNTKRGYHSAILQFGSIIGYRDAQEKIRKCEEAQKDIVYESAEKAAKLDSIVHLEAAVGFWKSIPEWRDADKRIIEAQRRIEQLKKQENRLQEEANKRNKKTKKAALMIVIALVLIVAALIVLFTVILPNKHYKEAVELYNAGQYEKAIVAFEALNGYRDSKTRILDCRYVTAEDLYNAGRYEEAIAAFEALNGHKDSAAQIEKCETAIKEAKYNSAVELYNAGKYNEAITAFEALDSYKDSAAQIEACQTAIKDQKYDEAIALYKNGNYTEATTVFTALNGYTDSADYIKKCSIQLLKMKFRQAKDGDIVAFGKHTWKVLTKSNDKSLIICCNSVKQMTFDAPSNWKDSAIRKWLNDSFLNSEFDENEQQLICPSMNKTIIYDVNWVGGDSYYSFGDQKSLSTSDKVFLLSVQELQEYLPDERDRKNICVSDWWERTTYNLTWTNDFGWYGFVNEKGVLTTEAIFYPSNKHYKKTEKAVVPAMWIDLSGN